MLATKPSLWACFLLYATPRERGKGEKRGAMLQALNFFINLLKAFYHFPTFVHKNHSATFTNYKISFYVRGPANGTAKSKEQED